MTYKYDDPARAFAEAERRIAKCKHTGWRELDLSGFAVATLPQNPVELERYSAPQPDLTLVRWSRGNSQRHPTPEEVFLIIEVADSSLDYDREEKLRAYAATGIREFWILNLQDDRLEIYRQPEGPAYREQITILADGTASPLAFPDVTIAVAEILPPR